MFDPGIRRLLSAAQANNGEAQYDLGLFALYGGSQSMVRRRSTISRSFSCACAYRGRSRGRICRRSC